MSDGEPEMAAIVEEALPGQEFDFEEWRRIQDWRRAEIDPLVESRSAKAIVFPSMSVRSVTFESGLVSISEK